MFPFWEFALFATPVADTVLIQTVVGFTCQETYKRFGPFRKGRGRLTLVLVFRRNPIAEEEVAITALEKVIDDAACHLPYGTLAAEGAGRWLHGFRVVHVPRYAKDGLVGQAPICA